LYIRWELAGGGGTGWGVGYINKSQEKEINERNERKRFKREKDNLNTFFSNIHL
jgi:hypothetical protein